MFRAAAYLNRLGYVVQIGDLKLTIDLTKRPQSSVEKTEGVLLAVGFSYAVIRSFFSLVNEANEAYFFE